ncbi:hypothetical protein WDW89_04735 [Deltaproteobacteria bacterium TL4]
MGIINSLIDKLNQNLFEKLGLTLEIHGVHLALSRLAVESLQLKREDKPPLHFQKIEIHPSWQFKLEFKGKFQCKTLTMDEFIITNSEGDFVLNQKGLLIEVEGYWQEEKVTLRFESHWKRDQEEHLGVETKLLLFSDGLSPSRMMRATSQLRLESPFRLQLNVLFPQKYFQNPDFKALFWEGTLDAKSLTLDTAHFPDFSIHTYKKEPNAGELLVKSEDPQGVNGKLLLTHKELYHLSGSLVSTQPYLSNYLRKYHQIEGLGENMRMEVSLNSFANAFSKLYGAIELQGAFQVTPVNAKLLEYEPFDGNVILNAEKLEMKISRARVSEGELTMKYLENFGEGKQIEFRLEVENMEIKDISQIWDDRYSIQGKGTGSIVYLFDEHEQIDYTGYNLKIKDGELLHAHRLIERVVSWKELREIRKQIVNIEGFKLLSIKLNRKDEDYFVENIHLHGHLQQKLHLSGTIRKGGRLELLFDASFFADMASWIFTIKGTSKAPTIMPAPAKMARKFVQSTHRTVKSVLGVLKDLTE